MAILIADKFEQAGIDQLRQLRCEVRVAPELKGAALAAAIAESGCRVLVVRSTQVTAEMFRGAQHLGLVVRAGAGTNNIDIEAASASSVFVANCPGKNAAAVAELTFGLILALDRRIPDNVRDLQQGRWAKKEYSKAGGLKGRTLGILGMGQIGQLVALRAKAFEMPVVGWSRSLTATAAARLGIAQVERPVAVAERCDILSVHLAATADTANLVGREIFDALKPGAMVINTARAEVMDYAALAQAVAAKGLRVGLDVYEQEPGPSDDAFADPVVRLGGLIYGTHHIGASTQEAQDAVAQETVDIIREYLHSGVVRNCVNRSSGTPAEGVLVVRHLNRPGVLAKVLSLLAGAGINVREMENVLCQGEQGACAQIRLDSKPSGDLLGRIEASDDKILGVSLAV